MLTIAGWIKLHKKMLNWEWYEDIPVRLLFLHLLLRVEYRDRKYKGFIIPAGSVLTTIPELSEDVGLSIKQIRVAIKKLESTSDISRKRADNKTLINLVNWGFYQSKSASEGSPRAVEGQSEGSPRAVEGQSEGEEMQENQGLQDPLRSKEVKEDKKKDIPPAPPDNGRGKPQKTSYAEFVSMTNDEYTSLVAKIGESGALRCIEILDNYKGASGKKYKSDYRAILNWVVKRYEEEAAKTGQSPGVYKFDS